MSDRIAVFSDGVVQQLASPSDIYERPDTAFVASFIGENNRIYGRVSDKDGKICTVMTKDGQTLQALNINIDSVGSNAIVSVRPERVCIDPDQLDGHNIVHGLVEELIYLGDHMRIRLKLLGQNDFIVKIPSAQNAASLQVGANVVVGWRTEDCRALDVPHQI